MDEKGAGDASSSVKIEDKALVCKGAILEGNITIGAGSIIHPKSLIIAKGARCALLCINSSPARWSNSHRKEQYYRRADSHL